jgi:hypothetical protein
MPSKKDIAIKENITKPHTVETFFKSVYIRKADDAIMADSLDDFMKQITDPCHLWRGSLDYKGYGAFSVWSKELNRQVTVKAHRFAYALEHGFEALPIGIDSGDGTQLVINHLCHNRACVNVKHLEAITDNENTSPEKRKPVNV